MKYLFILICYICVSCVTTKQITNFQDLQGDEIPHQIIINIQDSYENSYDGYSYIIIYYEYTGDKKIFIENKLKKFEKIENK